MLAGLGGIDGGSGALSDDRKPAPESISVVDEPLVRKRLDTKTKTSLERRELIRNFCL